MASSKKEHRSRQRATAGRSSSLEPVQPIIIINDDQIEEVKKSGVKEYVRVKERLRRNQERHGREHRDGWMDSDEKER